MENTVVLKKINEKRNNFFKILNLKLLSIIKFFIITSLVINPLESFANDNSVPCLSAYWTSSSTLKDISHHSGRSGGYYLLSSGLMDINYPMLWRVVVIVNATDFNDALAKAKEKLSSITHSRSEYAIKGKYEQYSYFCNYLKDDKNDASVFALGFVGNERPIH